MDEHEMDEHEMDEHEIIQLKKSLEDYRSDRDCGVGVYEPGTGFLLFNDGCMARELVSDIHGRTPLIEVQLPPKDETARRRIRIRYLETVIREKVLRYRLIYSDISQALEYARLGAGPAPPPGWEEELQRLAQQVETLREHLQAQIECLPETIAAQIRQRERAERDLRAREQRQRLAQLPVV